MNEHAESNTQAAQYAHVGVISSPAACRKCGSLDITTPFHGRRTGVWFAFCRDCHAGLRSCEPFTIEEQKTRRKVFVQDPDAQPERPFATSMAALALKGDAVPEWLPYREIGEEG